MSSGPESAPTPTPDAISGPAPSERSTKKPWAISAVIACATVALLTAGGITYAVLNSPSSPSDSIAGYFDALVDGDAQEALAYVESVPDDQRVLLQDGIYAEVGDPVSAYSITEEDVDDDTATVTVTVEQGDAEYEQELTLTRVTDDDGESWKIDPVALPVVNLTFVRPEAASLSVNGVDLGDAVVASAPVLPGTYEFLPTSTSGMVTGDPVPVTATPESTVDDLSIVVTPRVSEAGLAAARAAFDAHIDACVAETVIAPVGKCGYGMNQDEATYSNIRWSVPERPQVDFPAWNEEKGWEVVLLSPGHLRLDGDYVEGGESGTVFLDVKNYQPRGGVRFDDAGAATYVSTYE